MKAKVFVFLFSFLFLFTSISNIFAAEIIGDYEVKYGTDVSLDDVKSNDNEPCGHFTNFKYYYIMYTHEAIYGFYFNNLDLLTYDITEKGCLHPVYKANSDNSVHRVVYSLSDYVISSHTNETSDCGFIEVPCVGVSYENYYLLAHNFDIVYNDKIIAPSMTDDTIGDPNSRLQVTYEYNEDNTECKINATIKDGSFTDKIFYSNYMPGPSGHLLTKQPFPIDGITVTENQSLFFQAEDKDGNIIATNSISIYGIGKLNPELFIVDIDVESGGHAYFTPRLLNSGYIYNDIYCKIDNVSGLRITKDGFNLDLTNYASEFAEGKLISSGQTWNIANFSLSDCTFNIHFEIKNRETGVTMLTKTYNLTIKLKSNGSINGGTINSGQDDEEIMTPDNDDNINNDLNVGIDWSLESSIDNIKNFFVTATEFFNLVLVFLNSLPMWIIMPLYTLFTLAIIIFVFHAIRG